jgi:hypothetical protein
MLDINFLKNSPLFKERILKAWEYLFCEWKKDENIYIIIAWELLIEKFIPSSKNESKILATLKKDEIFWEAALNNDLAKQVSIKAKSKTKVIYINASSDLDAFSLKHTLEAFNLLKYIIHSSNTRLNKSNSLITASYEINNEIATIDNFNFKTIFELIEKIKDIIGVSDIIFLEENPVLKEYLTVKYKTSESWKMQDSVIKLTDNKLDLLEMKNELEYSYVQNIKVWDKNYGYLILLRKENDFSENEIKIISSIWVSFSNVLKQKELIEEQKNKDYIKDN